MFFHFASIRTCIPRTMHKHSCTNAKQSIAVEQEVVSHSLNYVLLKWYISHTNIDKIPISTPALQTCYGIESVPTTLIICSSQVHIHLQNMQEHTCSNALQTALQTVYYKKWSQQPYLVLLKWYILNAYIHEIFISTPVLNALQTVYCYYLAHVHTYRTQFKNGVLSLPQFYHMLSAGIFTVSRFS